MNKWVWGWRGTSMYYKNTNDLITEKEKEELNKLIEDIFKDED